MWREPKGPWPHRVAFREGRRGAWWRAAGAGEAEAEEGMGDRSGGHGARGDRD